MDCLKLNIDGHVLIKDVDSGEILINRRNAIHNENISFAIASAFTNNLNSQRQSGVIDRMAFGNGGTVISSNGNITYNTTNTIELTAELYNQTYEKSVNFNFEDDVNNNTSIRHTNGTNYTDVIVTCTLDYAEPVGQDPYDDTANLEGSYVFDEIGLVSQQGRLLTHLIFHPVHKAANKKIQVVYTVRITTG